MYAINTDFNPRYWIYLTNLGYKAELLKDKDIIWQCVSCNKCTNICPEDVRPEGVMKALQHWLESEGHVPKSRSTQFDEEFTRQCLERGRIEDSEVLFNFLKTTGENVVALVKKGWLGTLIRRMNNLPLLQQGRYGAFLARLPIVQGLKMGWALVFKPRTKSWGRTGEVLRQYVEEQRRAAHAKV
jgi:heterodisulfide reductase subunit C